MRLGRHYLEKEMKRRLTKDEIERLGGMLDAFFYETPDDRRVSANPARALAYQLALEPYSYAEAREAVVLCAREKRLYPSPAEIIAHMKSPATAKTEDRAWMKPYIDDLAKRERGRVSVSRYAREHGISWEKANEILRGRRA